MDILCNRFFLFCRSDSRSCQMRNPKDGYRCGNGHSYHSGTAVFLAYGFSYRGRNRNGTNQQQNIFISDSVRSGHGGLLAVLFSCTAKRGYERGGSIDKSSTVLTIVLALLFLGEGMSWKKALSVTLIGAGTLLMIAPKAAEGQENHTKGREWLAYAVLSAVFASLTAILGKIGIQHVDSNLGTAIPTTVVLFMAWIKVFAAGKQREVKQIEKGEFGFLMLSGLATGVSWLCYYRALQEGPASVVVPIDKLSILVTILFSAVVFGEKL